MAKNLINCLENTFKNHLHKNVMPIANIVLLVLDYLPRKIILILSFVINKMCISTNNGKIKVHDIDITCLEYFIDAIVYQYYFRNPFFF